MSDGHGAFALPRSYSPMYSPSSPSPPHRSASPPSSTMTNVTDIESSLGHPEHQPFNGTGHYRSDYFRAAPVGAVLSNSRHYRLRMIDLVNSTPASPSASITSQPLPPTPAIRTARKPHLGNCISCGQAAHVADRCVNDHGHAEQTAIRTVPFKRRRDNTPVDNPHPTTVSPALTIPRLVPIALPVQRPYKSPLWDRPVRKVTIFAALEQSITLALQFSKSLEVSYAATDPRISLREQALRDDNRLPSPTEMYYNHQRNAALPRPMLELLEKQRQAEVTHNWTQSRMPGANLILNHLRVRDLPEELATLHKPVHPHTDWEPFHDILAQIISLNVEDPAVKQILALHATPLHLEVLPNSEFYHDHVEAPHTLYYAATRQLIELVMEDLIEAAKLGGLYHSSPVVAYLSATQVRDQWKVQHTLPPTIFLVSPSLPLCYPPDHVHYESGHHPFMHQFEATFIEKITALLAFTERQRTDEYREIQILARELTHIQAINQANLSCQFLSGTFTKVRYQDIFDHNFEVEFPSHPSVSSRPSTPWGARSEDFHPDN